MFVAHGVDSDRRRGQILLYSLVGRLLRTPPNFGYIHHEMHRVRQIQILRDATQFLDPQLVLRIATPADQHQPDIMESFIC